MKNLNFTSEANSRFLFFNGPENHSAIDDTPDTVRAAVDTDTHDQLAELELGVGDASGGNGAAHEEEFAAVDNGNGGASGSSGGVDTIRSIPAELNTEDRANGNGYATGGTGEGANSGY